jgi:hypothetical protein
MKVCSSLPPFLPPFLPPSPPPSLPSSLPSFLPPSPGSPPSCPGRTLSLFIYNLKLLFHPPFHPPPLSHHPFHAWNLIPPLLPPSLPPSLSRLPPPSFRPALRHLTPPSLDQSLVRGLRDGMDVEPFHMDIAGSKGGKEGDGWKGDTQAIALLNRHPSLSFPSSPPPFLLPSTRTRIIPSRTTINSTRIRNILRSC